MTGLRALFTAENTVFGYQAALGTERLPALFAPGHRRPARMEKTFGHITPFDRRNLAIDKPLAWRRRPCLARLKFATYRLNYWQTAA